MLKRVGSIALGVQAVVLAIMLLAPEVNALRQEGLAGVGGYSVEAVSFPLSHTTSTPPAPGAPVITSFTPLSGTPLSYVQITGDNFTGVTQVTFGGVPSTKFVFFPSSGIALVPLNALTGPISVTNALGTGVSHDNYTVAPLILGGRGLNVSFRSSGPAIGPMSLQWQPGNAPMQYTVVRSTLGATTPPVAFGPLESSSFKDDYAPPGELRCYAVLPMNDGVMLGVSDVECGASGLSTASTLAPREFQLTLFQSQIAYLSWVTWGVPDAHVLVVMQR